MFHNRSGLEELIGSHGWRWVVYATFFFVVRVVPTFSDLFATFLVNDGRI